MHPRFDYGTNWIRTSSATAGVTSGLCINKLQSEEILVVKVDEKTFMAVYQRSISQHLPLKIRSISCVQPWMPFPPRRSRTILKAICNNPRALLEDSKSTPGTYPEHLQGNYTHCTHRTQLQCNPTVSKRALLHPPAPHQPHHN